MPRPTSVLSLALLLPAIVVAQDADRSPDNNWPGFRGPALDGVSLDARPPLEWSDDKNIQWQIKLPGPGSSSPVIHDGRVYVTSYSGYGKYLDDGGDKAKLIHHLSCHSLDNGKQLWTKAVAGPLEKEARQMQLTEHGFASPTPVIGDGRIFCYFGRPGVIAYSLDGDQLWQTDLGKPDPNAPPASNQVVRDGETLSLKWGSASSPILHEGLLILNCSEESNSLRALDQKTGKLVWKQESANLEGTAVTPVVFGSGEEAVLIMVLGGEIWGMKPKTGAFVWKVKTESKGGMSSTPVARGDLAYVFGGGKSFALRWARSLPDSVRPAEGQSNPRIAWTSKSVAIPSPSLYKDKLLAVRSTGFGLCLDPATGAVQHDKRLAGRTSGVYASPVVADDRIYVVSRKKGTFVYSADGKFELLAKNQLGDKSQFNASPALSGTRLLLRSDSSLYCIEGS